MYLDHFGLKEFPFSIAPNPRYLYFTHQHQEALAHLVYGLNSAGGIVLLTGEVGTGKTTISRKMLEDIPENIDIAWIVNPRLSAEELLGTICDELGIVYPDGSNSIKIFTDLINNHLIQAHGQARNVVVMIDEAQNLSPEVLEQLRLLTNLETSERKLLQIVLLGQPELQTMLERTDLRQLAQRITARYHLHALDKKETGEYIRHRLAVGGCNRRIFSKRAIKMVYQFSHGIPRLINLLCDRTMLGVYSSGNGIMVYPKHVRQAGREVLGEAKVPGRRFLVPVAAAVLSVASIIFVADTWPNYFDLVRSAVLFQQRAPSFMAEAGIKHDATVAEKNV
ncbi:MAG: ExeA family protein, partial [Mariprofundaceae bacterium]